MPGVRDTWTALFLAVVLRAGSWVTGCQRERTQGITERVILQPPQPVELPAGQKADAVVEVVVFSVHILEPDKTGIE